MNSVLHIFVMGALLAALPLISHWFLVFDAFIWATLREQAQHRYAIGDKLLLDGVPVYTVQKRTFFDFGWLGEKQVREILETTLGALLLVSGYDVWMRFH